MPDKRNTLNGSNTSKGTELRQSPILHIGIEVQTENQFILKPEVELMITVMEDIFCFK